MRPPSERPGRNLCRARRRPWSKPRCASGSFSAAAGTSLANGGLIETLSATTTAKVGGYGEGIALTYLGGSAVGFAKNEGDAFIDGAPTAATTSAVLSANSKIASMFAASPVFFAVGELGGGHSGAGSGPDTTTSAINETVDLTKLASRHDLMVGFYNADYIGSRPFQTDLRPQGRRRGRLARHLHQRSGGGDLFH